MSRRKKWAPAIIAALLVLAAAVLWIANTRSLDFPHQDEIIVLAPGESIEIEREAICAPNSVIRYEPSFFGRWRQTHVNGRDDVIRWYDIGSRSYDQILPCHLTPWVVGVPDDAPPGRIAVCNFTSSTDCVQIRVQRAE